MIFCSASKIGNNYSWFEESTLSFYDNSFHKEDNSEGLSKFYNSCVELFDEEFYIFSHDDIFFKNHFRYIQKEVEHRMSKGFDVLGVAGTAEYTIQEKNLWHLSNKSAHSFNIEQRIVTFHNSPNIPKHIDEYYKKTGELKICRNVPARCLILDGCLLIVHRRVFDSGIRFDEQFDFHHYDMDFCLQCNQKGFKMSTCLLDVVHLSPGLFSMDDEKWNESNQKFIKKWK